METYAQQCLDRIKTMFDELARASEQPIYVPDRHYPRFRHKQHSEILLCLLKGIKTVSTLNAALVLLRAGYAQEVNLLCRVADDCINDVLFMLVPHAEGKPSKDQERFFDEFFQEQFEDASRPLGSSTKRDNVARKKIHAAFGKLVAEHLNPSDAQAVVNTVSQTLSGYVHGAYPHIMELYDADPSRFHMKGMVGTRRIQEAWSQFLQYLHRCIMTCELVAKKLGSPKVAADSRSLLLEFEWHFKVEQPSPEELVKRAKGK